MVGDGEQLRTVLGNLVKNALTFTNEGGVVQVKAEGLPGFIKFTVADTGIGIPAGEQEKIFERFYQVESSLRRKHGGIGLGLALAREMDKVVHGRIEV